MPYINQVDRDRLDPLIDALIQSITMKSPSMEGELNYVISRLGGAIIKDNYRYTTINAVTGAIMNANAEISRRMVAPYEDFKKLENGDVPEFETAVFDYGKPSICPDCQVPRENVVCANMHLMECPKCGRSLVII